jgi:hypothetical protein
MVHIYNPNVVGEHILIDNKNIESDKLKLIDDIKPFMNKIVEEFKLNVVGECSHQFENFNAPYGASMIYLLSESHCLDARICSLSRVSFGLESASDGSGCRTHLRRDGSSPTTTPSTSTITSGTERRPHQRPALCRQDARVRGRSVPAGPSRRAHVRAMDCSCSPVAAPLAVRLPAVGLS